MANINLIAESQSNLPVITNLQLSVLETFLGNISFVVLFIIMLFYWVQAIFSIIPKFNVIISVITFSANLSLFSLLLLRWVNYNHFPLSNLYESLIFLSWNFTFIQLIFLFSNSKSTKLVLATGTPNVLEKNFMSMNIILGTIISPIALFTNSFATFSLPKNMQKAQALVPALQSNWLMMHVTVMMLSYTALLCGSLLAIAFLIITSYPVKNFKTTSKKAINDTSETLSNQMLNTSSTLNPLISLELNQPNTLSYNNVNTNKSETIKNYNFSYFTQPKINVQISSLANKIDNLSYRILGIGFPLLTIGILSGAVWANEAWGSYWSWDPKETWAFITWLIFAIYLHTRISKGWQGKKPAILASFGFFIVWICYLGVNILGTGLHSYGWIQ